MRHIMTGLAILVAVLAIGCGGPAKPLSPAYDVIERKITVDGDTEDWRGIEPILVQGEEQLWLGQGLSVDNWKGNADLSYSWRAAWRGDKLYFLFIVADDKMTQPGEPLAFLNDCAMLYIDPLNEGGPRRITIDGQEELRGFDLYVAASSPAAVFLGQSSDNPLHRYRLDKPQTQTFQTKWNGQVVVQKTPLGYVVEMGFSLPGGGLARGRMLGVENGVCDNDGAGRESLMTWSAARGDFWQDMSKWGQLRLVGWR